MSTQVPSQTKQQKEVQAQNQIKEVEEDVSLILVELIELGFDQKLIEQSLKHTNNKQKAVQIILRYQQQGLNANLSDILSLPKLQSLNPVPFKLPGFKYKMIFLVNMELKMGKGKICAQVGHACLSAYLLMADEAKYNEKKMEILKGWENFGCAKIVVRVESTKELEKFQKLVEKAGINFSLIEDAGKTQIKSGSKTVLGIGPVESQVIDPITKDLKLL